MSAPVGVWLVAGTPAGRPYPCRCEAGRRSCSPLWCPCSGRTDVWLWPPGCCAWVHTPAVSARAQAEYAARAR